MKNLKNNNNSFSLRLLSSAAIFGCLFFGTLLTANAQATTNIAQFLEPVGAKDYVFTNNTVNASFSVVSGGSPVIFFYQNITGLDASLQGTQNAHVTITTTTTTPGSVTTGTVNQPLNQTITIAVIRDTPAAVGNGTRRNLLTATITPNTNTPLLTGSTGGNSANLNATTSPTSMDHNVVFTSDFLNFAQTTARNLSLAFSAVTPQLALGTGNFLQNFTAAGAGTFASNPVPTVSIVTAASATVGGRVSTPSGRGLRNALVTVTQADGSTRTVLTGVNGTYSFGDLTIPQTVVLSVRSKSYRFTPQVVTLDSDLAGVDFFAESYK